MRALILSDIHANIDALEAVLAAAPPHDAVWNLGDIVGYGAAPSAVLERVRGLGGLLVRGNHDRACCGLTSAENFNPIALAAVRWTQRQLDAEAIQWLRAIPKGPIEPVNLQLGTRILRCVHGSLLDEDEYLLSARDAEEQPASANGSITFFGHTHVQGGFAANAEGNWWSLQPAFTEDSGPDSDEMELRESATYWINPGSVGQPRDNDWRAAFAVFEDAEKDRPARITFHRVPYDVRLAQMRIQRAGLPDKLGSRLRIGR